MAEFNSGTPHASIDPVFYLRPPQPVEIVLDDDNITIGGEFTVPTKVIDLVIQAQGREQGEMDRVPPDVIRNAVDNNHREEEATVPGGGEFMLDDMMDLERIHKEMAEMEGVENRISIDEVATENMNVGGPEDMGTTAEHNGLVIEQRYNLNHGGENVFENVEARDDAPFVLEFGVAAAGEDLLGSCGEVLLDECERDGGDDGNNIEHHHPNSTTPEPEVLMSDQIENLLTKENEEEKDESDVQQNETISSEANGVVMDVTGSTESEVRFYDAEEGFNEVNAQNDGSSISADTASFVTVGEAIPNELPSPSTKGDEKKEATGHEPDAEDEAKFTDEDEASVTICHDEDDENKEATSHDGHDPKANNVEDEEEITNEASATICQDKDDDETETQKVAGSEAIENYVGNEEEATQKLNETNKTTVSEKDTEDVGRKSTSEVEACIDVERMILEASGSELEEHNDVTTETADCGIVADDVEDSDSDMGSSKSEENEQIIIVESRSISLLEEGAEELLDNDPDKESGQKTMEEGSNEGERIKEITVEEELENFFNLPSSSCENHNNIIIYSDRVSGSTTEFDPSQQSQTDDSIIEDDCTIGQNQYINICDEENDIEIEYKPAVVDGELVTVPNGNETAKEARLKRRQLPTRNGKNSVKGSQGRTTKQKKSIFFCTICCSGFATKKIYYHHQKSVHQEDVDQEKFPCQVCGKMFATLKYALRHELTHTGSRSTCWTEPVKAQNPESSQAIMVGQQYPYPCKFCNKKYRSRDGLIGHLTAKHSPLSDQKSADVNTKGKGKWLTGNSAAAAGITQINGKYISRKCTNGIMKGKAMQTRSSKKCAADNTKLILKGKSGDNMQHNGKRASRNFGSLIKPIQTPSTSSSFAASSSQVNQRRPGKSVYCSKCGLRFHKQHQLELHERYHELFDRSSTFVRGFVQCPTCKKGYNKKIYFQLHQDFKLCHKPREEQALFSSMHRRFVSKKGPNHVPNKSFPKLELPAEDQVTWGGNNLRTIVEADQFPCKDCTQIFTTIVLLKEHWIRNHLKVEHMIATEHLPEELKSKLLSQIGEDKPKSSVKDGFTCRVCYLWLRSLEDLTLHSQLHTKQVKSESDQDGLTVMTRCDRQSADTAAGAGVSRDRSLSLQYMSPKEPKTAARSSPRIAKSTTPTPIFKRRERTRNRLSLRTVTSQLFPPKSLNKGKRPQKELPKTEEPESLPLPNAVNGKDSSKDEALPPTKSETPNNIVNQSSFVNVNDYNEIRAALGFREMRLYLSRVENIKTTSVAKNRNLTNPASANPATSPEPNIPGTTALKRKRPVVEQETEREGRREQTNSASVKSQLSVTPKRKVSIKGKNTDADGKKEEKRVWKRRRLMSPANGSSPALSKLVKKSQPWWKRNDRKLMPTRLRSNSDYSISCSPNQSGGSAASFVLTRRALRSNLYSSISQFDY